MTLKDFHLVFIVAAILLCAGISHWGYQLSSATGNSDYMIYSVFSALAAVGLVVYEIWFWKRSRAKDVNGIE